jgi:hypothetical protein
LVYVSVANATLTRSQQFERDGLEAMAPLHVNGVRDYLVDLASDDDFEAVGRVVDAVADKLVVANSESEIR